jgi:hypothetical protein
VVGVLHQHPHRRLRPDPRPEAPHKSARTRRCLLTALDGPAIWVRQTYFLTCPPV